MLKNLLQRFVKLKRMSIPLLVPNPRERSGGGWNLMKSLIVMQKMKKVTYEKSCPNIPAMLQQSLIVSK